MGHERVGVLPKTRKWRRIVEDIAASSSDEPLVASIAERTIDNVRTRFRFIQSDPGVLAAFQFLVALSAASRFSDPSQQLAIIGILLPDTISPFTVTKAIHQWVSSKNGSNEYGNIAKSAAGDAVAAWYQASESQQLKLLESPDDPLDVWRRAGTGTGFCEIARLFFARFTERYLRYFLDREASSVISSVEDRELFQQQLRDHLEQVSQHAFETSKITQSFAAGWFNNHAKDGVPSPQEIEGFLFIAFGKLRDELSREQAA